MHGKRRERDWIVDPKYYEKKLLNMAQNEVDCNGTEKIEDTQCCVGCGEVYSEKEEFCKSCGLETIPFSKVRPREDYKP
jgi:rRNA maturation endonuclease Nob1